MSTTLARHLQDYLRLRRALGFTLQRPGQVLPQFIAYLDAAGLDTITVDAAIAWARLSEGAQPVTLSHRLGAVRGFARYLATIDPATQIPPCGLFGKQQRHVPYIYSPEQITALLAAAGQLRPQMRAVTFQALLGLLDATGMRGGEAPHTEQGRRVMPINEPTKRPAAGTTTDDDPDAEATEPPITGDRPAKACHTEQSSCAPTSRPEAGPHTDTIPSHRCRRIGRRPVLVDPRKHRRDPQGASDQCAIGRSRQASP